MVSVRVASFNIRTSRGLDGRNHWLLRRRACVSVIRSWDADVIGLQEVRRGQGRYLARALRDVAITGEARDVRGGERAAVLVRHGRWHLESSETRWLSPHPDEPGSRGWGARHPRVVTLARLRCGDAVLCIANTHLDHASAAARERSSELLTQWTTGSIPWVITGDLNAPPDSTPIRTLLAAGFTDPLADAIGSGTVHGFTGVTDRARIDYVLAGPGVRVISARVDRQRPGGRLPSDHWPVVVDLDV